MAGRNVRLGLSFFVLTAVPVVAIGGCDKRQEPIPAGSFRVVVGDVVADDLVLVKRVTITAAGMRVVSILEKGGEDQITADPDRRTRLARAQVVFVADLIDLQPASENTLRWMVRMKSGGTTVGGPGLSSAGSAASLRDVLARNVESGIYPLSQDVEPGHVQGRELVLKDR